MKSALLLTLLLSIASCNFFYDSYRHAKANAKTWTVVDPQDNVFKNWDEDEFKQLLGVDPASFEADAIKTNDQSIISEDPPLNFDAREKWSNCIHPIRDQGKCGSCWAFAVTEAMSDRFCIASKSKLDIIASPQHLVSCNTFVNKGCQGGVPIIAWGYSATSGLVTEACYPYTSGQTRESGNCLVKTSCVPKNEKFELFYNDDSTVRLLSFDIEGGKKAIMTDGPLAAAFFVYDDFMHYKSGIYVRTSSKMLGGHAVKVVGWGQDDMSGLNYWVVANSWSPSWGDKGYFKIKVGECLFEAQFTLAKPDLS